MKDSIIYAGQNLKIIFIDYTEKDGSNEGLREVEPYSFRIKGGIEIFFAHDLNKGAIRGGIISSINDIKITENMYSPRWKVEF
ncbi:hypothetical protein B0A79_01345 [Flavobacterium piscis]|uniref:HK97 family phage prohead protease n=1 Tax=Flavobacterium piscis TaxID=1114874 RepID=A0ABX2XFU9_9FLAO|nr:hypothetical protein [Flavobacterium piscis]OCB70132.1 hypothetical protein FLP_20970 [Flavobacterium piscis]OXG07872.1 hypothetical protein B0A79_01345 [Flavobacterium piscis]